MSPRLPAARVPLAWLVSVAAHALLAGWLAHLRPGPRPAADRTRAIEAVAIEISESLARAESSVDTEPKPKARLQAQPEGASPRAPQPGRRRHAEAAASPTGDTTLVDDAEPDDAPAHGDPTMRSGAPPRSIDLSFGALPQAAQSQLAGAAADAELRLPSYRRPTVAELAAGLERQEDAVANVEKGRADPILHDYLRGARKRFEAEARRLADSIDLGAAETVRSWQRGYLRRHAIDQGQTRDPVARSDEALDAVRRSRSDAPATDVFAAQSAMARIGSEGAERRAAQVCLDMGPGKTPTPALQRSSGNAALDRLVVDSFERAIAARPVSPDARTGLACYEVAITASRMPPLPVAGCAFDASGVECVWPFKKVTSVSAKLLSVDYPRAQTTGARPPLIRPAR